jgi:hypothetical protein
LLIRGNWRCFCVIAAWITMRCGGGAERDAEELWMLREEISRLRLRLRLRQRLRDADAKELVARAAENDVLLRESCAIPSRFGSAVISNLTGAAGAVDDAGEDS